jgi:hypothetical protein
VKAHDRRKLLQFPSLCSCRIRAVLPFKSAASASHAFPDAVALQLVRPFAAICGSLPAHTDQTFTRSDDFSLQTAKSPQRVTTTDLSNPTLRHLTSSGVLR